MGSFFTWGVSILFVASLRNQTEIIGGEEKREKCTYPAMGSTTITFPRSLASFLPSSINIFS